MAVEHARARFDDDVRQQPRRGAIERRDAAVAAYKPAKNPSPLAKPEYTVVWSAKQNAADVHADVISQLDPERDGQPAGPGRPAQPAVPARPRRLAGHRPAQAQRRRHARTPTTARSSTSSSCRCRGASRPRRTTCSTSGRTASRSSPARLFTDVDVRARRRRHPEPGADRTSSRRRRRCRARSRTPTTRSATAASSAPTWVARRPTSVARRVRSSMFKPDAEKGLVLETEVAGRQHRRHRRPATPTACPSRARSARRRPLGTCANPHGIQIRQDLGAHGHGRLRRAARDRARPGQDDRQVHVPPDGPHLGHVRSGQARSCVSVAHMPNGPLEPAQRAHEQYGMMEDAKTWPYDPRATTGMLESKGMFAGSMCGGGIFFTPDITKLEGDSSEQWKQVWNDGLSRSRAGGDRRVHRRARRLRRWCLASGVARTTSCCSARSRVVTAASDNYFDQGSAKMIYNIDIRPLIKSAQDGEVDVRPLARHRHDGDGTSTSPGSRLFKTLAPGQEGRRLPAADLDARRSTTRPAAARTGARWTTTPRPAGRPDRLMFSNYFVVADRGRRRPPLLHGRHRSADGQAVLRQGRSGTRRPGPSASTSTAATGPDRRMPASTSRTRWSGSARRASARTTAATVAKRKLRRRPKAKSSRKRASSSAPRVA